MVCSAVLQAQSDASSSFREKVACLRVSRNSCRMSISSTMGMGRSSMRPGNSSSVYLPALHFVAAFERGRGRTQHHARAGLLRPHHGHIAPVVARRLFLLVGCRRALRRPRSGQVAAPARKRPTASPPPPRLSRAYAPPLLGALDIRERAVQNGPPVAESKEELARHGRGEGDFRHQQQGAAACASTASMAVR